MVPREGGPSHLPRRRAPVHLAGRQERDQAQQPVGGSDQLIQAGTLQSQVGKEVGTLSGIAAAGLSLGPVLGGFLVQFAGWRWIFFINVPVALAVVALALIRRGNDATALGIVSLIVSTTGIILGPE